MASLIAFPPRVLLVLVLALGFGARVWNLDHDVVGHHQWRQADTAAVAHHYATSSTTFLQPMVDWGGVGVPGVEMELPLYQYAVGVLWSWSGETYWSARLLSVAASLLTLWLVYLISREELGPRVAQWAVMTLAVLPTGAFYGRAVQPEAWMVLSFCVAIYSMQRWSRAGGSGWLVLSAVGTALAISLKLPSAVIGLPLLGLVLRRDARPVAVWAPACAHAAFSLGVPLAWYAHAADLGRSSGRSFGIVGSDKWWAFDQLIDPGWWWSLWVGKIAEDHLAIVGVPLALLGIVVCVRKRLGLLLGTWGLAMLIHMVVVSVGNRVHDYYQLPLIPVFAMLIGVALSRLYAQGVGKRAIAAAGLVALVASSGFTLARLHGKNEADTELSREIARAITERSAPGTPVVLISTGDPTVLRLADRFGWTMGPEAAAMVLTDGVSHRPCVIAGAWRDIVGTDLELRIRVLAPGAQERTVFAVPLHEEPSR